MMLNGRKVASANLGVVEPTQRRGAIALYFRFCLVGGSGVVVDLALLLVLYKWFGVPLIGSKVVAAMTAMVSNFLLNDFWTFRCDMPPGCSPPENTVPWWSRFLRFVLICASGMVISVFILNVLVITIKMPLLFANIISILIASIWNFMLNSRMNWK